LLTLVLAMAWSPALWSWSFRYSLARAYDFSGASLARAIAATFTRRNTPVPADLPYGLSPAFADEPAKQRQWRAFADNMEAKLPPLAEVGG
jgi:hypothetical protein